MIVKKLRMEPHAEEIYHLWDTLTDYPASRSDEALSFLMDSLSKWLRADDIIWIGAVRMSQGVVAKRDPQYGWRGLAIRHMNLDPKLAERSQQAAKEQDTEPAETTRRLLAGSGCFRVHRLQDGSFVDLDRFKETAHYRIFYQEVNIVDRLFVGVPINGDTESILLFDRRSDGAHFTEEDAELVSKVMRGLKWFQQRLLLSHGLLVASEPLTHMERRIVQFLLTDSTEKEIASNLGQAPATTHKYITGIFRKFGVRGRAGFMALWLGH